MRRDVRRRLIKAAKSGNTITYGSLMKEFHISRGGGQKSIGHVVGSISEYEDQNGRPLISAIVVRSGSESRICPKGQTGGGFFSIPTSNIPANLRRQASDMGNPTLTPEEKDFLWKQQNKVWAYWKTHEDDESE
jgi:hypothetical protein